MAMQRFFEFFRRKNYGAFWNNLFNFFHLVVLSVHTIYTIEYETENSKKYNIKSVKHFSKMIDGFFY